MITAQSSVMLKAIAGSVLVNRQMRDEAGRNGRVERVLQFYAACKGLPWIFALGPPSSSSQWICGRVINLADVIHDKLLALSQAGLVVTVKIRKVYLEPLQAHCAKLFTIGESEE